ncbi:MAG: UTP--glucose-1-phosphate uridylyltransferase [Dehalococcoidia bacterium]|nr:UTP--glucose-1-phosphate uridylyltransferase [Dehalococcoidia bacterium]MSQ16382.1 UTP--glucose-1-phosphate uridylyltransferase [Dehalococcoidia bacterium]
MTSRPPILKAVIPAAGLGTRFLPATKAVPKELLPILDKPALQYVVEEAAEAGIQQVIIVIAPGKESIVAYFQPDPALERRLTASGAQDLSQQVHHASHLAQVSFVIQQQPLGLGHAVLMAKQAVGNEPFVVMLPDDIVSHTPGVVAQMLEVYRKFGGAVVAVAETPWESVHNYGVVAATPAGERVHRVRGLVEKPPREQAPSNLAIVGRYLLPPEIFDCLERTPPGAKGEIQLTDGMALLLENHALYACQFQGRRYDTGTPLGLLRASLEFALAREDTRESAQAMLKGLL